MSANDDAFPDGAHVLVRYPTGGRHATQGLSSLADRKAWPWLSGTVEQRCGPNEWLITVMDRRVAELQGGSPAPAGTPDDELRFPRCCRDSSEIRALSEGR